MPYSVPNFSGATGTRLRTRDSYSTLSGMCTVCVDDCPGLCEIGRSAFRAQEAIYPQPFGEVTSGAEKAFPVDLSHFQIVGRATGAWGVEPDPDVAVFTNVRLEQTLGNDDGVKLLMPFVIPGLGSTKIAAKHFDGLAAAAAITGTIVTVGENVCAMDDEAELSKDNPPQVLHSPALRHRVKSFLMWQDVSGGGQIVVQENLEDRRLGVLRYAIEELGVQAVELKWGQGAKSIGGEVKIDVLAKAQRLKRRGYIVLPDPDDPAVIDAYDRGALREFERHSRIGFVDLEAFCSRVEELRRYGAKWVFLKTGAYAAPDLARALKYAAAAKVDVVTVDAAGGGTGMSPWRMMNEWGVPPVELLTLTRRFAQILHEKGEHVPDIVFAGGIAFEDQVFKVLALGAPYVKAIGWARAPICAAHVAELIVNGTKNGESNQLHAQYGTRPDQIFVLYHDLKRLLGPRVEELPPGAIGVYHFYRRVAQGLQQLMCGARKFALEYISADDVFALTREASDITGVPHVMDYGMDEAMRILEE
ncbi:MAG: FMN-binding glutamate synthase family protein [Armatimonadetes bacterium]|nr:FMN-binding glutamate synthase family protein [Armatimonadota bacterium]